MRDIMYTFIGGVGSGEILEKYPEVVDMRLPGNERVSENYYPNWSRAAFADIRNVKDLVLDNIQLRLIRPDGRPPVLTEGCTGRFDDIVHLTEKGDLL